MSANPNFDSTMARWKLFGDLLAEIGYRVQRLNAAPRADPITITAPLNLLNQFHVYRLAHPTPKIEVNWEGDDVIVYRVSGQVLSELKRYIVSGDPSVGLSLVGESASSFADAILNWV